MAQGRSTILKLNYRSTREILDFVYRFAKDYLSGRGNDDIPLVKPEVAGVNVPSPELRRFANLYDEMDYTIRYLRTWSERGKSWGEIAVLYPMKRVGNKMSEELERLNVPHKLLGSGESKKNYQPGSNELLLMPIPSSKGLEFDTVIIVDSTFSHSLANIDDEKDDAQVEELMSDAIRRLYVGMTRAKKNLLVTYHRENLISDTLEKVLAS